MYYNNWRFYLLLFILSSSPQVLASGFQLWEQDGASIANYHAGYAALASDASIAWYNPAGIPRIRNQQLVLGSAVILTDFKYKGTVIVQESTGAATFPGVTAQGGTFNVVPNLHYVAPLTDRIGFGFSITAPFGLKTNYGRTTPLKYAATLTSIKVIDVSPSIGFQINDHISLGAGFDIQRVRANFNNVGLLIGGPELPLLETETESQNQADGTGYGYHLGFLYQIKPNARVGLSYHSQVTHHLTGSSKFIGPISEVLIDSDVLKSNNASTRIKLPAYTALSTYYQFHPRAALMATAVYTQWSVFKNVTLKNIAAAIDDPDELIVPSTNVTVIIPQHFRNTWNLSFGADYYLNDQVTLRGAIGYDQTPVPTRYRNVQLPDKDRYVFALGGHYQMSNAVGLDVGWTHLMMLSRAEINPPPQVMGGQTVFTNGEVRGGGDVYGMQITWNLDKPIEV